MNEFKFFFQNMNEFYYFTHYNLPKNKMDLESYLFKLKSVNDFSDFDNLLQHTFSIIIKYSEDEFINESSNIIMLLDFLCEQIWPNKRIETLHCRQLKEIRILAGLIANFLHSLIENFRISKEINEKLWLFALIFQCDYIGLIQQNRNEKFLTKFLSLNKKSNFDDYLNRTVLKNMISILKKRTGEGEEWPTIIGNSNIIDFIFSSLR